MQFNRIAANKSPCVSCDKQGCGSYHDICPAFLEWRKKIEERNEAERKRRESNDVMSEAKKRHVWRSKRYSRQVTYSKSQKAD